MEGLNWDSRKAGRDQSGKNLCRRPMYSIDAFNCSAPGPPPLSGPLCLWDVLQGARPCFG